MSSSQSSVRSEEINIQRGRILLAAITANLFANVSLSGLNVALPAIEEDLRLSAVALVWVSSSLILATAAAIAPVARLADTWGRRRTTLLGLVIIIISSLGCSLAGSAGQLLAGRVLMGLGLAMIFAATMALAANAYPPQRRGMVFGYIVSAVYVGLAMGPGLCGVLVEILGWPSLFWVTSLSLTVPLVILVTVKNDRPAARGEKYDYGGAVLWMLTLSLTFIGLTNLMTFNGRLITGAGLAVGGCFVLKQLKADQPLLDLRLFWQNRRFGWASLAAFIAYSAALGSIFLLSLYLQYVKGFSPKEAGFFLMVQPTVQALLTPLAGRLSDRYDPGRIAAGGLMITTGAVLMISLGLSAETGLSYILISLSVFGVGFAAFAAPNSNAVMSSVPGDRLGMASGIITATRLTGQIFSLSFTALVFSLMIGGESLSPEVMPDFIRAARFCFMFFAPLCFVGALVSLIRNRPPDAPFRGRSQRRGACLSASQS